MIKIEIVNSGAAFDDESREAEIARILRAVADRIEGGAICGLWTLRDINGNFCGNVDFLAPDCGDHPPSK